jgi:hypothetical protein
LKLAIVVIRRNRYVEVNIAVVDRLAAAACAVPNVAADYWNGLSYFSPARRTQGVDQCVFIHLAEDVDSSHHVMPVKIMLGMSRASDSPLLMLRLFGWLRLRLDSSVDGLRGTRHINTEHDTLSV